MCNHTLKEYNRSGYIKFESFQNQPQWFRPIPYLLSIPFDSVSTEVGEPVNSNTRLTSTLFFALS